MSDMTRYRVVHHLDTPVLVHFYNLSQWLDIYFKQDEEQDVSQWASTGERGLETEEQVSSQSKV